MLTKGVRLDALTCPTAGLYCDHHPEVVEPTTAGNRLRAEVGRRARGLFSEAVMVDEGDFAAAVVTTQRLVARPSVSGICERAFTATGFAARADILLREGRGWKLVELDHTAEVRGRVSDFAAVLSGRGTPWCRKRPPEPHRLPLLEPAALRKPPHRQ